VSTCSLACSPANRPAPWRWTSSLGRPGGERGAAAGAHARRRPRSAVDPRASHALPTLDHLFPARPDSGSDDQAARRPQRHVEPGPPNPGCPTAPTSGIQRGPDSADAEAADTGRPSVRTPVCPDTWITPDAWTPDARGHRTPARPGGRTSARRRERRTAWPASGHPRRPRWRRPPAGRPNLARVAPSSALGNR
jgi:hypothetical protein